MITLHMEYMSKRKLIIDGPTTVPCYIHLYFTITWCYTCTQTLDINKLRKDSRKDAKLGTYSHDAQISFIYIFLNFLSN